MFKKKLFPWPLRQSLSNRFRFCLAYLVLLDVDVVPIKVHLFLFGEKPAMIIFVFLFFSILAVSMATAAILNKSTLKTTTSHGI